MGQRQVGGWVNSASAITLAGLWERFDPAQLATSEAFRADPGLCWGWYEWRRQKVLQAQPSGAHLAIAELASYVPKLIVVTQNVDDLHERAGSHDVVHLHASLHSPRCIDCGLAYIVLAHNVFRTVKESEPFGFDSDDVVGFLMRRDEGYEAMEKLLNGADESGECA